MTLCLQRPHLWPQSPPNASPAHDAIKLIGLDAPCHARAAVGLENHVLEQLLVDLLLEHGRHPPQVRQRNGPVLVVGEEAKRLVDGPLVRLARRLVLLRVELERADGEEGLVRRVAVRVWVEDGEKFGEFGW